MKWLKGLIACACVLFAVGGNAYADSYNVNAVVPYEAPTNPASITLPVDNFITSSASINVSGTCEYVAPGTVVVITRNASIAGSSACSVGGAFTLVIALTAGSNQLIARTANLNSLYGPDSIPVTVQYNVPPGPPSQPEVPSTPSTQPLPESVSPSLSVPSDLTIKSDTPIHLIDDTNKTVSITVQVSGGETPYDLIINWGDGTVETRRIEASGSYTFTYEYSKPGTYRAVATVTDVKGISRQYNFTVISPSVDKISEAVPSGTASTTSTNNGWKWWYWLWWIIPLLVFCFALGMYVESRWIVAAKRKKRKKKK